MTYTPFNQQGTIATVEGFDELFKTLDAIAEEIGKGKTDKIWKKAMDFAMQPVLRTAKDLVPFDTGITRDHIYMKTSRPTSRDKTQRMYQGDTFQTRVTVSAIRDESTKHTTITKTGKERVSYKKIPAALSKEFGNAVTQAQPFMRPALDINIATIQERLGQAIWYEMQWGKFAPKS